MKNQSFVSDNRYSSLRDLKDNRTEFSSNEAFNSRRNSIANSRNDTQVDDTSASNKQVKKKARNSVVIVGDSIIKQVDQRKMSSNKTVKVRSFPGATIEDMADYSRSLLRNNPSSLIVDVGTNNLKNDDVYTVRNKLLGLKDSIEEQYPNTAVILSTLTKRTYDPILEQKVNKVISFLLGPGLNVVNNNNISHFYLNRSKLHLNYAGTALIAKNFIDKIRSL